MNALFISEGKFTREVHTKSGISRTILDFFVVCDKILPHIKYMKVDEKGEHALTRYKGKEMKTDYNMLIMELD